MQMGVQKLILLRSCYSRSIDAIDSDERVQYSVRK